MLARYVQPSISLHMHRKCSHVSVKFVLLLYSLCYQTVYSVIIALFWPGMDTSCMYSTKWWLDCELFMHNYPKYHWGNLWFCSSWLPKNHWEPSNFNIDPHSFIPDIQIAKWWHQPTWKIASKRFLLKVPFNCVYSSSRTMFTL